MRHLFKSPFKRPETFLTLATIFLPICVYIIISFTIDPAPTSQILLVGGFGLAYFLLNSLIDEGEVFATQTTTRLYFIGMSLIGLIINFAASPGYMWIILAPLVGAAESTLNKVGRWLMYGVMLLGCGGPYVYHYGWEWQSIYTFLLYSPAILFIVTFTRLTVQADQDKDKAEALTRELEEANRKLGDYAIQAEEMAMTQERNRIAREIHDNLGHYLTVINVQLEAAKVTFDLKPEKSMAAIDKAQTLAKDGLGAIRNSIASLRENPAANRPVPEAIAELILENEQAGIATDFQVTAEPRSLSPNATLTLYRIVQEALTNVRKHAQASEVFVQLDYHEPETVHLKIRDNGVGSAGTGSGFGLMGITERVTSLGGTLAINTAPESGFELAISIPG